MAAPVAGTVTGTLVGGGVAELFVSNDNSTTTPGDDSSLGTTVHAFGGTGNDAFTATAGADANPFGGAGDDAYVFAGANLGTDAIVEADAQGDDALDFTRLAGPVNPDLARTDPQVVSPGVLTVQLIAGPGYAGSGTGVETVLGTPYADSVRGNARDNRLLGGLGPRLALGAAEVDRRPPHVELDRRPQRPEPFALRGRVLRPRPDGGPGGRVEPVPIRRRPVGPRSPRPGAAAGGPEGTRGRAGRHESAPLKSRFGSPVLPAPARTATRRVP